MEIWIADSRNERVKLQIGEKLRFILNMEYQNLVYYFKKHDSSLKVLAIIVGLVHIQRGREVPVQVHPHGDPQCHAFGLTGTRDRKGSRKTWKF